MIRVFLILGESIGAYWLTKTLLALQNHHFTVVGAALRVDLDKRKPGIIQKIKNLIGDRGFLGGLWYLLVVKHNKDKKDTQSIKQLCKINNIPLIATGDINDEQVKNFLKERKSDLGVVTVNKILKEHIFKTPRFGCLNCHNGLLPDYRGSGAIFWALYNNDDVGYTIHKIDKHIDTGEIVIGKKIKFNRAKDLDETIKNIKKIMYIDAAKELVNIMKEFNEKGFVKTYKQEGGKAKFFKLPSPEVKKEFEKRFKNL